MARHHDIQALPEGEEFLDRVVSGVTGLLGEGEGEEEYELEEEGEEFHGGSLRAGVGRFGEGEEEYELEAEEELEGEYEGEFEDELEAMLEGEYEEEGEGEEFLGGLVRAAGSLLGEGEGEEEYELEAEYEDEGEEFFRRVGRMIRRAAPILRTIAKTAGPLVATAVGGPAAGLAARAIASQLEGELEDEGEFEAAHREAANKPLTAGQAAAELMAAQASAAASEAEAEALAGAAAVRSLSARDRAALESVLPALVRGAAVITRVLHGSGARPFIRIVPTLVDETGRTLLRRARRGAGITPATAARTMAVHTARVLGSPRRCRHALLRNQRGIGSVQSRGALRGAAHGSTRGASYGMRPRGLRPGGVTRGVPVRTRTLPVRPGGAVPRRAGASTMRVVTPVRVPGSGGRPSRLVRVVTDVRVPRGARPTTRTATITRAPGGVPGRMR
ncbi:hypothetical protein [Streptomyces piniterrae]|uniref:hypothetical protein n=1 Tax=Streptomyces piniterrae TaxID=2571125 RepID=UPI001652779B|nr:hypothetical protein [Streptomyces piniterrae]